MDSDPDCSCDDFHFCRPALPRIKSCLKSSPSHSGASTPSSDDSALFGSKKHVAFREDGTEEVYEADEWDRTPAEIQRLSYEDVLELKMLQRELPRAEQPIDALSSKPFANVFLSHVPIPLLPLNPTTVCASQSTPPNMTSPPSLTTTPARDRNPPPLCFSASSICSPPPPIEYRRSPPKSLPDQHVIRPHNIPVPPPPVPLRRITYPPAPSTTQTQSKIKSTLPPKRTFSFVPLLDDSSHCRPTATPASSTTTTPSGGASPVTGSALLSGTPEPPPLSTLSASASSASLSASSHSSSSSDPDRCDQGYVSDCSITELSTPSLTTASLASSSPPESPGLEHDSFYEHGERAGRSRRASRSGPDDDNDIEQFMLNLDMDDVELDLWAHHHPPPSLTMQPIHADAQKDGVAGVAPPPPLNFVSRVPISPFHVRHPHLNRPTFATVGRSSTNKTAMNGSHTNRTGSAGYEDAAHDNSHDGGCSVSVFDPLHKLRLHAVPSPDLDAPSPLELPPGTANVKGPAAAGGPRKIRMGLVPLAEPVPCHQDRIGTLFGADEGVISPSLSRSS